LDHLADIDSNWLKRFRRNSLAWYGKHGRDLVWRNSNDAYRVWISEIMLQQTTVTAVVPYFERFLKRFPNIQTLAAANEEDVLKYWEGLGYYSRARNIHKTACLLVEQQGGQFPDDVAELQKLPGIGRYTAGAIASFAFNQRAPIVEANTLRLYSRLLGYAENPRSSAGQKLLWEFAEKILPQKSPGQFNQAVMDLGATVCTPKAPSCPHCPVKNCCAAFANNLQESIPVPAVRPKITHVEEASVAVGKRGKFLLVKRPEGERWAGLWDFPRFELPETNGITAGNYQELEFQLADQFGLETAIETVVTEIVHSVTRYRIRLYCLQGSVVSGRIKSNGTETAWVSPTRFEEYPLSVTGRKFATLLAGSRQHGVEQ